MIFSKFLTFLTNISPIVHLLKDQEKIEEMKGNNGMFDDIIMQETVREVSRIVFYVLIARK